MRSAIFRSAAARCAGAVRPQASRAAWAASSAASTSSAVERAHSHTTWPDGDLFSKYRPRTGATQLPPMKLS